MQRYATVTEAAAADLFFSEYIEGSSNNKAIEIYNGTGTAVNMTTGNYVLQLYSNGSATVSASVNLTATVADGDVYVVAHGSANATILAQADLTSSTVINFNGDDAVVLRKGGATGPIVDVIGQIGNDPGTEWGTGLTSTADNTLRRKATICAGDTNGSDAFNPATEWDGFAQDDVAGLGSHTASCGGADAAPTVTANTPTSGATNVPVNTNVTITFSEAVNVSNSSFTISCGTSGAHTFALSGSGANYTLNPDTDFASSETCTVTVVAANVTDTDTVDPPDNMASNYVFTFTTAASAGACGDAFTPVFQIQGSSTSSPFAGSTVTTEAVVTADFQLSTQQSGFYIQDPSGDGNTATSDGVFVFQPSITTDVAVGDRVRVTGRAVEFNTMTEIDNVTSIQICSTGNTPPLPVAYDLPEPVLNDLERVEGMRVTFPEPLTVTGNNLQGRFGEVMLSSEGRLFQQNSFDRPNSAGALARAESNRRRQIMLDDASSVQNPNPIPYIGADNTLRAGDTTTNLTGVIDYGLTTTNGTTRDYRVQPTATVTFARTNPRPAAPANVGGTLKVASSNVLNYFNGDGAGGGFPTSRGATTPAEFTRQRDKIISAIVTMNPDVLGVIEIENDGFNNPNGALQDLVNGLNNATAPGTFAGIDSPNPGTDEIKNAIIYKPASVTPSGAQVNDVDPAWNQARAPLAQTFQQNSNSEKFTFIVNHFTSKGCSASDTGIDADTGDGQGCDNGQRQIQANRLLVFIQDRKTVSGDPDVLSMGDYNAYAEEDPIFIMEQDSSDTLADGPGGLVSETKRFVPAADRYSYQFDAAFGELDHALATKSMNVQVTGTTIWHINADEPTVIDYNTEFKTQDLYTPTPYRSSDHDPIVVGIRLGVSALPGQVIISEFRFRGPGTDPVPCSGPPLSLFSDDPSGSLDSSLGGGSVRGLSGTDAPNAPADIAANNEFIEFYNATTSPITVSTTDGSAGWALVAADGATRFIIPNGTTIPARGHFLAVNTNGYAFQLNVPGDTILLPDGTTQAAGYTADIPDGSGIALFNTANSSNFLPANRLDAAGYAGTPALYFETTGFPVGGAEMTSDIDYSFVRDLRSSFPKDTGNNAADFIGVQTYTYSSPGATGQGAYLGAPGPENLASPTVRLTSQIIPGQISPGSSSASPNRVRNTDSYFDNLTISGPTGSCAAYTLGTLSVQKRFTNNTGGNVSRLRFRIVEITTLGTPYIIGTGTQADLRVLTSNGTVRATGGAVVTTVRGLRLDQPPLQDWGGGWNSSVSVDLSGLPGGVLAPGQSVDVQFLLGVASSGSFRFFITSEASN